MNSDVRHLIRTALRNGHPVRAIARTLGLAPATVAGLALPDGQSRSHRGSLALAEQNAPALEALASSSPHTAA